MPISYEVDPRLAGVLAGGAGTVDRAFSVWSNVPDTNLTFRSAGLVSGAGKARDQRNTVSLSDDLYSVYGYIAQTTTWNDANTGKIIEADIQIDASLVKSNYNIPMTIEHEIGHMLGLDHSAVISSVMYPFVGKGNAITSLDSDDRIGIMGAYPKSDPALLGATLEGKVMGNEGGVFAAQVVAVNDRGQPVATALTDTTGSFIITGVPAGTYRLYAEPLDGPVDSRNLAGMWRSAKNESFSTRFVDGPPLRVENGRKVGNLMVNSSGAPVKLNPRWIGLSPAGSADFELTSTPVALSPGSSVNLAVGGDGIVGGMTTFEVLNPGFRRTGDFRYASNFVYATFAIDSDATPGSAVVLVTNGSQESATLTGALRVVSANGRTRVASK